MKITSVDILALPGSEAAAFRPIICRVNTDEGIYGLGEAGVAIVTGARAGLEMIKDLSKLIIGMNPLHHEVIWEKMFKQGFWTQGNGAIEMAAISAIDTALWDIKGKYHNAPVHELLGGKQREKLRTYASQLQFGWGVPKFIPQIEPEQYAEAAIKAVEEGYSAIKINVLRYDDKGQMLSHLDSTGYLSRKMMKLAEARLAAMRDAVGDSVDILLENHAMTDAAVAVQFGRVAEKYDIMFLEEAAMPMNPKVMAQVADKISIPLASGERSYTRWGFLPFFENGSLSIIQPDIGNCGGITECKKIADMAHIYDVSVQTHVCSSPISVAVSLQLEAAIPNFVIHEHHLTNATKDNTDLCVHNYQPVNGYFDVPDLPGIGQDLSEFALKHAEVHTVK